MKEYGVGIVPDPDFYVDGLTALANRVTAIRRSLLTSQYYASARRVTASQLATLAGISGGYPVVNLQYGRLGRIFCETTGFNPDIRPDGSSRWWNVWSIGFDHPDGFIWEMHQSVATALELLGWVDPSIIQYLPEEIPNTPQKYYEGSCVQIPVSAYERNAKARLACLEHHGYDCVVCNFNFVNAYGSRGKAYIHVHHLIPLSKIKQDYVVDPVNDLRPICPNCHAMIHRSPMLDIDELRQIVTKDNK